jgi:hypothetical protein
LRQIFTGLLCSHIRRKRNNQSGRDTEKGKDENEQIIDITVINREVINNRQPVF